MIFSVIFVTRSGEISTSYEVYLFCVDGLKGFVEAIGAVYPCSQVQRCIVHQIRSSTRFVSWKDVKQVDAVTSGMIFSVIFVTRSGEISTSYL